MASSSAALALRESFGDRKPVDISRKITACVACRKQKLKCNMNGLSPPCTRCKARGLSCTVNKSLQMLLENEIDWKEGMEQRMKKVEAAFGFAENQQDNLPSTNRESKTLVAEQKMEANVADSITLHSSSENLSDVTLNLSCGLGSFPASSMTSFIFNDGGEQISHKPDLISRRIITLEEAEGYFTVYQKSMEPCIYQILREDDCLANVRARSSFLTAAICTVGSLSGNLAAHQKCYGVFMKEVSGRLFSMQHNYDDVHALCIGAFWLTKMSSTIIGLAVRIALDLNLHRCITKMPHTKRECYERTRLYYLVYICDHHCSLIHGRPPMTRDFRSLKIPKAFLQSEFCKLDDLKLISQVELWSINSRVFDVFGADTEAPITIERADELDSLSYSFDLCRSALFNAISPSDIPGNFSRHMFDLYILCGKLSLFSHAFRGSKRRSTGPPANIQMEKFERNALEAALAIVRFVVLRTEIQGCLENLPSYFGIMIAFASVSLIKASGKEPTMEYLDMNDVSISLNRLVEIFQVCSERVQPGHPLRSITKSLRIALNRNCQSGINHSSAGHMFDTSLFNFDTIGSNTVNFDFLQGHSSLVSYPSDDYSQPFPLQNC